MKSLFFTALFLIPFAQVAFLQPVNQALTGAMQQAPQPKERELVVQFAKEAAIGQIMQKVSEEFRGLSGLVMKKTLSKSAGFYLFAFDECIDCEELPAFFAKQNGVLSASWNLELEFRDTVPNDPFFFSQWDMKKIGLPSVWSVTTGGQTAHGDQIVVAVLERGLDLAHEEFQGNIWENPGEIPGDGIDNDGNGLIDDIHGWNFRINSPFFDVEEHGTNVLGIMAAKGDNHAGIAGINWRLKAMMLGVRYTDEVISAFDYVLEQRKLYNETQGQRGAFVVVTNGSFGLDRIQCSELPVWAAMYDYLGEAGVLSVAATINENVDVDVEGDVPTSCPSEYLIAVTSTDSLDHHVSSSGFGKKSIDLGAPGRFTATTSIGNGYRKDFGGTSSACPHVSGSVALLYSLPCTGIAELARAQPAQAARLIRDAVLYNVYPLPGLKDKTVSGGRLDVFEAMKYLHAWCISKPEDRLSGEFKEIYMEEQSIIRLYPNPVREVLRVDYSNDDFAWIRLRVFNAFGQEVVSLPSILTKPFESQYFEFEVSGWPTGVYFLTLSDLGRKVVRKFVKL